MFKKILIANRGEIAQRGAAAQPNGQCCLAAQGDFVTGAHHV
ncbi:MAG: hypothetical protein ACOVO0_04785 [Burkholderiaceae bacterium]